MYAMSTHESSIVESMIEEKLQRLRQEENIIKNAILVKTRSSILNNIMPSLNLYTLNDAKREINSICDLTSKTHFEKSILTFNHIDELKKQSKEHSKSITGLFKSDSNTRPLLSEDAWNTKKTKTKQNNKSATCNSYYSVRPGVWSFAPKTRSQLDYDQIKHFQKIDSIHRREHWR